MTTTHEPGTFAVVPLHVLRFLTRSRATAAEVTLITAIYSFRSDASPRPFASQATLGRVSGLDRRRLQEALAALVRDGLLAVEERTVDRGPNVGLSVNSYDLPRLEALAEAHPDGLPRTKTRPERGALHDLDAKVQAALDAIGDGLVQYDQLLNRLGPAGAREEVAKHLDRHLATYHRETVLTSKGVELVFYQRVPFDDATYIEMGDLARDYRHRAA